MTTPHAVDLPDRVILEQLRDLASAWAQEAARLVVTDRPRSLGVDATKSSEVDVVTVMDRRSEQLLRQRIAEQRPGDAVLGEEEGVTGGTTGLTWVIDPIDGTVNYLYEHPLHAVSVAVCVGDATTDGAWTPIAGAVSAPMLGETFVAAHGLGAELVAADGRREELRTSGCERLPLALVGTGFGYEAAKRREQGEVVARLLPQVRDIRRGGSAALDLCFVAAGRLDAYYESGINAWDQAAGQVIATEAGARVSGPAGGSAGKELVVAAAPGVHDALRDCLSGEAR